MPSSIRNRRSHHRQDDVDWAESDEDSAAACGYSVDKWSTFVDDMYLSTPIYVQCFPGQAEDDEEVVASGTPDRDHDRTARKSAVVVPLPKEIVEARTPIAFLSILTDLCTRGSIEAAMYLVYDQFDRWLYADQRGKCEEALGLVASTVSDPDVLGSVLGATIAAKDILRNRAQFVDTVRARLETQMDNVELNDLIHRLG